jgi:hypothetical protein
MSLITFSKSLFFVCKNKFIRVQFKHCKCLIALNALKLNFYSSFIPPRCVNQAKLCLHQFIFPILGPTAERCQDLSLDDNCKHIIIFSPEGSSGSMRTLIFDASEKRRTGQTPTGPNKYTYIIISLNSLASKFTSGAVARFVGYIAKFHPRSVLTSPSAGFTEVLFINNGHITSSTVKIH